MSSTTRRFLALAGTALSFAAPAQAQTTPEAPQNTTTPVTASESAPTAVAPTGVMNLVPIPGEAVISGGIRISPTGYATVSGNPLAQPVNRMFQLRNRRGRVVQVRFSKTDWGTTIPTDGTFKLYGSIKDGVLLAENATYDDGLHGSRAYSESKPQIPWRNGAVTGSVVEDADEFGFDLRDAEGVIHSVVTYEVPKSIDAKALRKGDTVRLYGGISIIDNVSQVEPTNIVVLGKDSLR
ncbi:MAG TPA: hypothetical protein VF681_12750 [Abditibacteriaceae bacterium]|jgi:hypothetical protein